MEGLEGVEKTVRELALCFAAPSVILKFFRDNTKMGNVRGCVGVASALGAIKAKGVEDVLDMFLNHGNPDVRCYAYLAMARIGTEEAASRILSRYPSEKHPYALGNLVLGAGLLLKKFPQNKELFDLVNDAMKNAAHANARAGAALAWGVSGHSNAFDMVSFLVNDRDPVVVAASHLAFGLSNHESAVYGLKRGMTNKSYSQVREYSAYGMGVLKNEDGLRDLIDILKDSDIPTRSASSISYGAMRVPGSAKNLESTAEGDANFDVRRIASISMILCGEAKGFEYFVSSYKGRGDSSVRIMDYAELTEVSNLYVPIGYRIDDYLQDAPVPAAESGTPAK
jgi:HEAT repeat protein